MAFGFLDALPAIASIAGGIMGNNAGNDSRDQAMDILNQNRSIYNNIDIPDIEKQRLALEMLQSQGNYSPELLSALQQQGPSALENVQLDPKLRQSQMTALESMSDRAMGKMSDADMAAFELARKRAAGETQAKSAQILQQMQARGQGGSGAALAAQLSNAQAGGNMLQDAALQEAVAQQRARESALMNMGNMANSLRSQDYGQATDLANRRDAINQMNTNAANQLSQGNVNTKNQAQQLNLQNTQNIANQNVGLRNQQQQLNKNLYQNQFNNQMTKAAGQTGASAPVAQQLNQNAANQANMWGSIGQGVGNVAQGYLNREQQGQQNASVNNLADALNNFKR